MQEKRQFPKISVITVVYNAVEDLPITIESVASQTYPNLEYIIIDGGSRDGTKELIEASNQIDYWVSEPDRGIYDAMNKGIQAATGQWLNFLNAGDRFFNPDTLLNITFESYRDAALIYGNTFYRERDQVEPPAPLSKLLSGGIMGCHQSMFFNQTVLEQELVYDRKLRLAGDSELVTKIYAMGFDLVYLDIPIADYMGGGASAISEQTPVKLRWNNFVSRIGYAYKYFGIRGLLNGVNASISHRITNSLANK